MAATAKKDLRTGQPVWLARRMPPVAHAPMKRSLTAEIVVVGAGISGAMVADALASDGHEVVLIDRRGPLKGSTPATTALVQYEIDEPVISLARMIGTDKARQAWRRTHQAVQNLAARIGELQIDCALQRRNSLYLAGNQLSAGDLKRECLERRLAGIETTYLTRGQLEERYGITGRSAALVGYGNLAIEPVRLTAGLLRHAVQRGARIYAPSEMSGFETDSRSVTVSTTNGTTLTCKHLILCTGYEIPKAVPQDQHRIISTWALATKPQRNRLWPEECFIWEASDPYLYMRTTADGRVICGGEDADFADEEKRDALLDRKIAAIRRKLARLLPKLDTEPEFAWTANFGMSTTGLPSIGALPGHPRVFALLGYGGNGITYSRIGAELLRAALAGATDPDAGLFAFAGKRSHA